MSKRYSRDEIDRFHDYHIHIPSRTISIFSVHTEINGEESGVEAALADKTIKNLILLESLNKEPITIILNTPGGDYYHGMAIYDAVRSCKSHVTIKGIAQVMSMGAVILQAGDVRLLYENTKLMIHYGYTGFEGHSKTHQKWAEEFKKIDLQMEQILLSKIKEKHPRFTLAKLKEMLDHDTILSAQEAVELGLADGIVGPEDGAKEGGDE